MARMSPVEPLVEEAMKKAAIAWVSAAGHEQVAVWCLWHEGALFVVSGPGEQPAPGLAGAATAIVATAFGGSAAGVSGYVTITLIAINVMVTLATLISAGR